MKCVDTIVSFMGGNVTALLLDFELHLVHLKVTKKNQQGAFKSTFKIHFTLRYKSSIEPLFVVKIIILLPISPGAFSCL